MMKFLLILLIFVGIEIHENLAREAIPMPCKFHEGLQCNTDRQCGLNGKCTNTNLWER